MGEKSFVLSKKMIAILTVVLVVVVGAAIVIAYVINNKSEEEKPPEEESTSDFQSIDNVEESNDIALYIKDDKLYMAVYPKGEIACLADNFLDIIQYSDNMDKYVKVSENGKKVFYLDDTEMLNGKLYGTLYCVQSDRSQDEHQKIAEKVSEFRILEDKHSDSVSYLAGVNNTLYFSDLSDSVEISSSVADYEFLPENEAFYYKSYNNTLYYKEAGKPAETIADNIADFMIAEEEGSCIFYKTEYNQLQSTVSVYKKTVGMSPEQISSRVSSDDFAEGNVFCESGEGYYTKYIEDKETSSIKNALCYYDGYSETILQEYFVSKIVCRTEPAAIFCDNASRTYLAIEDNVIDISDVLPALNSDSYYQELKVAEDGAFMIEICFRATGLSAVYRIVIEDGEIEESELYESSVAKSNEVSIYTDETLVYYKNLQPGSYNVTAANEEQCRTGDLYINKQLVAQGVDAYRVCYYEEPNQACFFTGWNTLTKTGTLNLFDGEKSQVVAENVSQYQFADNGSIMFVKDNNLFIYADGKTEELQQGVSSLPAVYNSHFSVS